MTESLRSEIEGVLENLTLHDPKALPQPADLYALADRLKHLSGKLPATEEVDS